MYPPSRSYLQMEAIEHGKMSLKEISGEADWSMEFASNWPQQNNSFDCGVFAAIGCECVALGMDMMMNSERACFFRRKIGVDILNGELI